MSASSKPRVTRKNAPKRLYTEATKRKALPLLLDDFSQRCAYSMMHVEAIGMTCMEVDHHNPNLKGRERQRYTNLFPAHRICNNAKRNQWPSPEFVAKGIRLLNPCVETEYGEQIFEDAATHELIGVTPAARYHIVVMDLNNPALVTERNRRTRYRNLIAQASYAARPGEEVNALAAIQAYKEVNDKFIPDIPPPPLNGQVTSLL